MAQLQKNKNNFLCECKFLAGDLEYFERKVLLEIIKLWIFAFLK